MALRIRDNGSLRNRPSAGARMELENLAAELTEAAYPVALRHGVPGEWLDVELELWKAMTQTVRNWQQRSSAPCA